MADKRFVTDFIVRMSDGERTFDFHFDPTEVDAVFLSREAAAKFESEHEMKKVSLKDNELVEGPFPVERAKKVWPKRRPLDGGICYHCYCRICCNEFTIPPAEPPGPPHRKKGA